MTTARADEGLLPRRRPQRRPKDFPEVDRLTRLFLRARAGEPELYGAVADEARPALLARLRTHPNTRALGRGAVDAEDVVQEAFLRAWARRSAFDPRRAGIASWLWVIAHNAAVDTLRRRRSPVGLHRVPEELLAIRPRPGEGAERGPTGREAREALQEALRATRNPKERAALEMRLLAGKTYATISRELQVPVGTVAGWVHRLRRRLARRLAA